MSTVEWFRFGFECFQTTAILIAGLVALYEYRRFRQYGAKAQLDLDFDLYPLQKSSRNYLLNIRPTIKNMGKVRQKFPVIELWVLTPAASDINTAIVERKRFKFSRKLFSKRNIVHDPADPYFIDPGVIQVFPYQVVISEPSDFIQVVVRFFYQVSWPAYFWLRIVACLGWSHRWQDPRKIQRLIKYKVDEYHIISKVKQVQNSTMHPLND